VVTEGERWIETMKIIPEAKRKRKSVMLDMTLGLGVDLGGKRGFCT
jgi:hypothetical protein